MGGSYEREQGAPVDGERVVEGCRTCPLDCRTNHCGPAGCVGTLGYGTWAQAADETVSGEENQELTNGRISHIIIGLQVNLSALFAYRLVNCSLMKQCSLG